MKMAANKQFGTKETIQKLLRYEEIMFNTIEYADNHSGSIPESQFYAYVVGLQQSLSSDLAKEVALVFDVENLMQARIINDRRSINGSTKLIFNADVLGVFRLCKVSLHRPLTKISLNAAMTPLWSLVNQVKKGLLSTTPGTDDYNEWVDDLTIRVSDILGKIKSNVIKLQNMGQEFESMANASNKSASEIDIKKERYAIAAKICSREIEPLSVFLKKGVRYQDGDGIFLTLEFFRRLFTTNKDRNNRDIILSYELQYLDLFLPIKQVADQVSIYLQKTEKSLLEYNAIEKAYSVLLASFDKTLSSHMGKKFIDLNELGELSTGMIIPQLNKLTPFRVEKSPSFLDVVYNELAVRTQIYAPENSDVIILSESICKKAAQKIHHAQVLSKWTDTFDWPMNVDFIEVAHNEIMNNIPGFKVTDLFEIQAKLIHSPQFDIALTNQLKTIHDDTDDFKYRVRHLIAPISKKDM